MNYCLSFIKLNVYANVLLTTPTKFYYQEFDSAKELMRITGERIDWAVSQDAYTVNLGVEECEITSVSSNVIVFRPPVTQPAVNSSNYFIYNDIQWGGRAQVGFNAGDGHTSLMTPEALSSSTLDMEELSNVDQPGVFVFRIDSKQLQLHQFCLEYM